MSEVHNHDSKTEETVVSSTIYTPLTPREHKERYPDTIEDEFINTKSIHVYVYALLSFVLFFLFLFPYLSFVQWCLNSETYESISVITFVITVMSKCVIDGVRNCIDGKKKEIFNKPLIQLLVAPLGILLLVYTNISLTQKFIYDHGVMYLLLFPLWLALVPSCYVAYHFVHRSISAYVGFVAFQFSSVCNFSVCPLFAVLVALLKHKTRLTWRDFSPVLTSSFYSLMTVLTFHMLSLDLELLNYLFTRLIVLSP